MLLPCVCVPVKAGVLLKWLQLFLVHRFTFTNSTLCCKEIRILVIKNKGSSLWNFHKLWTEDFYHGMLTITSVIIVKLFNNWWPLPLSHWTSAIVHNTMGMMPHVAWVCLRQLRHVCQHLLKTMFSIKYLYVIVNFNVTSMYYLLPCMFV